MFRYEVVWGVTRMGRVKKISESGEWSVWGVWEEMRIFRRPLYSGRKLRNRGEWVFAETVARLESDFDGGDWMWQRIMPALWPKSGQGR
jgi:hypothetical protein